MHLASQRLCGLKVPRIGSPPVGRWQRRQLRAGGYSPSVLASGLIGPRDLTRGHLLAD